MLLINPPKGLNEIKEQYGNPDLNGDYILDKSFPEIYLKIFDLPFPLRLSWRPGIKVSRIQAHISVGDVIRDALKEIHAYQGEEYLEENGLNLFGGTFNFRTMRGRGALSTHSWGIAIDINPHLAPLGQISRQPEFIIKAFESRGFEWGGHWARPDGMHFQACRGY